MSSLLANSSVESYDFSAFPPALPEMLAERSEEVYPDEPIERKIYLDIMLDILGSKRQYDVDWRTRIEPDQWEDAVAGRALKVKFGFDKMRGQHG